MDKRNCVSCPSCASHNIARYLYGMPVMDDKLEQEIEDNKVILADCCVTEDEPAYHCNDCGKDFGRRN